VGHALDTRRQEGLKTRIEVPLATLRLSLPPTSRSSHPSLASSLQLPRFSGAYAAVFLRTTESNLIYSTSLDDPSTSPLSFATSLDLPENANRSRLAMDPSIHLDIPRDEGAVFGTRLLYALLKQIPSSQLKLGDRELERARKITHHFESVIGKDDYNIIYERITL
jgi:hypothetical protein